METVRRFFGPPDSSFFLFGPRGTGKSTLIRTSWPDALVFDLLDPRLCRTLAARPEELAQRIRGAAPASVVVIDEVQRVPELLSVVHSLIEERVARAFVLTGSSARKLKRTGEGGDRLRALGAEGEVASAPCIMANGGIHSSGATADRLRRQAEADGLRITARAHQEMVEEDIRLAVVLSGLRQAALVENYPTHKRNRQRQASRCAAGRRRP